MIPRGPHLALLEHCVHVPRPSVLALAACRLARDSLQISLDRGPLRGVAPDEVDGLGIVGGVHEAEVVFRQVVGRDDPFEQVVELLKRALAPRLVVQHADPAGPPPGLVAGVLAGDPVDGSLDPAR